MDMPGNHLLYYRADDPLRRKFQDCILCISPVPFGLDRNLLKINDIWLAVLSVLMVHYLGKLRRNFRFGESHVGEVALYTPLQAC